MFKISLVLCILGVNGTNQNICFDTTLSPEYETLEQCRTSGNALAEAVDEDFKMRGINASLRCGITDYQKL